MTCPGSRLEEELGPGFKPDQPAPLPPEPLCYPASPKVQQERKGELRARESQQHGGKKIPPGLIKCLINSRRRIGRNNEHLSESFIAYNTLSPAFSHVIDLSWPWLVQLVGCSSTPHVSLLPTGQPGHTLTVMTEAQERASPSVQPLFKPLLVSQLLTSTGEITRLSPRSRGYSTAPCSCRRALQSHMAKSVGAGKG